MKFDNIRNSKYKYSVTMLSLYKQNVKQIVNSPCRGRQCYKYKQYFNTKCLYKTLDFDAPNFNVDDFAPTYLSLLWP